MYLTEFTTEQIEVGRVDLEIFQKKCFANLFMREAASKCICRSQQPTLCKAKPNHPLLFIPTPITNQYLLLANDQISGRGCFDMRSIWYWHLVLPSYSIKHLIFSISFFVFWSFILVFGVAYLFHQASLICTDGDSTRRHRSDWRGF